ncbi:hypothetical protein AAG906_035279 [Vitis piasezkii]
MPSTSFDPHIINYEMLFIVLKFTMYDGTSDLFNHIMHFNSFLVPSSPVEFCEHFPGYIGSLSEHKHPKKHQAVGERVTQRLHEVVRASRVPSGVLHYGCHLVDFQAKHRLGHAIF